MESREPHAPEEGAGTRAVHGTQHKKAGPVATPVHTSATYRFDNIRDLAEANAGRERKDSFYSRYGNVNFSAVEDRVASLEGAEASLVFASGMAAITSVMLTFLKPGARLLALSEIYGGTVAMIRDVLIPWGASVELLDLGDRAGWEREAARGAAIVYIESPTNPLCHVADLSWFAQIAKKAKALLVCDATFASPINQQTIALGADLSLHSATKYLGGHSDLLGGVVSGARPLIERLELTRRRTGCVADPEQAWRLERSLKTLHLRVTQQNATALAIAQFLEKRPEIERVHYPGLPSHPHHALAKKQMKGFGGMLAFDLKAGVRAARRFAEALRVVAIAPSLGGVESLISPPVHTSHHFLSPEERKNLGIEDGSLRLSVGAEDPADLLRDLERGFDALR
jgi:cystathionine gamma-synthase